MWNLAAKTIKLIETILVKAPPLWVGLGIMILGVLGFVGMVTYNKSNLFCMMGHEPNGVFVSFDENHDSHVPYKKNGRRCLTCHTDKDFYTFAGQVAQAARRSFREVTSDQTTQLPAFGTGYTDAQCLACHHDVLKLDKADRLRLPPRAAEIGLVFSHRRHFWMRDYPAEAAARLAELEKKSRPNDGEKKEIEFLQRARMGRCAQCHDRQQPDSEGRLAVDRNINYFSINPMRCESCHLDATPTRHPGTVLLSMPSEETCRRCHTGSFHGRFAIFRAQCDGADKRDCTRCHPDYRPPSGDAAVAAAPEQP